MLRAGLVDVMVITLMPILLDSGRRRFDGVTPEGARLQLVQAAEGPGASHLQYRISTL